LENIGHKLGKYSVRLPKKKNRENNKINPLSEIIH
jgi:hypothetical protein